MEQQFYSLLTQVGKAKVVNYHVLGKTLNLSKIQVGDGGDKKGKEVFPTEDDTQLVNLRWEGNINRIYADSKNENYLAVEAVIPEDIGGWYITEFGIVDDEGDLVVIGGYPKTYKPKLTQGSGSSLYLKVLFEVSNAENVQLKVDPSVVLASQGFVSDRFNEHLHDSNPHKQYLKKEEYSSSQKQISAELSRLPIYPEVLNKDHRLTVTKNGNGTITIDKGQVIRWRGHKDFPTENYTEAQRTFNIDNNKTYHLRWSPDTGFSLNDLEGNKYNPEKLDEIDKLFDTQYDDMLVCKIGREGIISLINSANLMTDGIFINIVDGKSLETRINWSRTPRGYVVGMHDPDNNVKTDYGIVPDAFGEIGIENTRYNAYLKMVSWNQTKGTSGYLSARVRWEA
ncbi:phage tail protein [Zooshikella sp. RANM57]|uniref:phage tail protein n=1 Tax=Zooshikella sp. RANM57 TaxID=3425863 RepID=UPI003D6F96FC